MSQSPQTATNQIEHKSALSSGLATVIILSFNSKPSIDRVIKSCAGIASRILVVDSFSSDDTVSVARSAGAEVVQHPFENYSKQRNWAQEHAALAPDDWVLHLDSDEVLTPELAASIKGVLEKNPREFDGYLVQRLSYFLGRPIRYGHINPSWHLRLYRAGKGACEDRNYDQHFIVEGKTRKLTGHMLDLQLVSIESWTASHNRWSSAEAQEILSHADITRQAKTLPASMGGDIRMKKRWMKNRIYYRCPMLIRAFVFFGYSYFLRFGFLDGKAGLIYHVLQAFWFRFLVDAKIIEHQMNLEKNANIDLRN